MSELDTDIVSEALALDIEECDDCKTVKSDARDLAADTYTYGTGQEMCRAHTAIFDVVNRDKQNVITISDQTELIARLKRQIERDRVALKAMRNFIAPCDQICQHNHCTAARLADQAIDAVIA